MSTSHSKKTIFYKKEGRKYVPVHEYDSELMQSFPKGSHLVVCHLGGTSTRYNIDPNYAVLIAASQVAEDAMSDAIHKATEIRRQQRHEKNEPLTPSQKAAWEKLVEEFGPEARQLEWPSVRECAEAGVRALQEEAEKLMQHESVRLAYEHFLTVCKLTQEHE